MDECTVGLGRVVRKAVAYVVGVGTGGANAWYREEWNYRATVQSRFHIVDFRRKMRKKNT